MNTKWAIIATVGWIVLVMAGCLVFLAVAASNRAANLEERAEQLGSGAAVVTLIGCAAIWGIWFSQKRAPARPQKPIGQRKKTK
jgi:hypothetical protein